VPDDGAVSPTDPRRAIEDAVGRMNDEPPSSDLFRVRDADVGGGSDTSDEMDGDGWMVWSLTVTVSSAVVVDACMMSANVVFQSSSPAVVDVLLADAEVCFVEVVVGLLVIFFSFTDRITLLAGVV